jgi:cytochrome c-type biogenesis protein CcmH/NrfG
MYMKFKRIILAVVILLFCEGIAISQEIPDDPLHLPTKIGGEEKNSDGITISGKIRLNGFPLDQVKPAIYVAVYNNGRSVIRRQVAESGSYSLSDIPRGSTIVVEIDHNEVESFQILPSPSAVSFKDFDINWDRFLTRKSSSAVVSVDYVRSNENQGRVERAVSDINKGNNDNAISQLKVVVDADPKDYYAFLQLGNAYFLKSDLKDAETAYLTAIRERPAYTLALVNLGKLYLSQHDNEKAIAVLTQAVKSDSSSADANQFLGEAYLAIKKGSNAVVYLNEALRLAPIEKAEIHLRLAALYNAAGLKSRASAEYQEFLKKVPKYEHRDELKKYIAENPPEK